MTDWDLVIGYIRNAMGKLDESQVAAQELAQNPNLDNFNEFRTQMAELQTNLQSLLSALNDEDAYAFDELVDALSKVHLGHVAAYRRTPRMQSGT